MQAALQKPPGLSRLRPVMLRRFLVPAPAACAEAAPPWDRVWRLGLWWEIKAK